MEFFTSSINFLASIFTIGIQIISAVILISLFTKNNPPFIKSILTFFSNKAILVSFVAVLCGTLGSLIYSDVIGYEPCKLCWFQRIFMYPQVVLWAVALWKKNLHLRLSGFILSIIGGAIALFHYVGQLGFNPFGLKCLVIGYSASCSKNFVLEFGYITIPMMALSIFAFIIIVISLSLRDSRQNS